MSYAKIANGAVAVYPYSYAQLRADNPQTSFPNNPGDAWLEANGIFKVEQTAKPADTLTTNFIEGTPILIGAAWAKVWNEVPATAEQIAQRQQKAIDADAKTAIKADSFVPTFIAMTPSQVASFFDNNFPTLTPAERARLGKMAIMLLLLARREFR